LPEGVSTPSVLATYVNLTNNIDNERKTNRGEESKQKKQKSMTVSSHHKMRSVLRIVGHKMHNFSTLLRENAE